MRIEFQTEGGIAYFPGLSNPVVIDSDTLGAGESGELQRLLDAAQFFNRPSIVAAPRHGAADVQQYTITVDEGGRQHTLQLTDPVEDPALRQLLRFLQTKSRALRRGGEKGR
jgi:hypothetical protein